jgi:hypothetical protein
MNEQSTISEVVAQEAEKNEKAAAPLDELTLLKKRADVIGVPYKSNIGTDSLKKKIEDHLNPPTEPEEKEEAVVSDRRKSRAEMDQDIRDNLYKTKMRMVRVRISNMNPAKADIEGEIITVANRFLGTVRKYIPFGEKTDGGYHVPQVLLDVLKSKKFQQVKTKKVKGQIVHSVRMVSEFSIDVLDPLTAEELSQLKDQQEAAQRLDGSND